jgi:hypothetical protein
MGSNRIQQDEMMNARQRVTVLILNGKNTGKQSVVLRWQRDCLRSQDDATCNAQGCETQIQLSQRLGGEQLTCNLMQVL